MAEKTPEEMKFWTTDMVVEFDKFTMNNSLNKIETNYNFQDNSWTPTILQRFAMAVNQEFLAKFPVKGTLSWDMKKEETGPVLEVTIRTEDYGSLSVPLPIDKIKSPKCPKNLPAQLISNFIKNFKKKINK